MSFIEGNVNGRELFVTTRKPAGKRGRAKKKQDDGDGKETPKRGRTRKRDTPLTPGGTPAIPKRKNAAKPSTPRTEEIEIESVEPVDVLDGTETSQADNEEDTQMFSDFGDDGGFDMTTDYHLETPTQNPRDETPLPVEPYRSFRSSPPSSPVYEEYQVPIPTSSSPVRPPRDDSLSFTCLPTPKSPIQTPTPHDQVKRRRPRSRSASRERRMSIAPIPQWQGLPATPRRSVSKDFEDMDVDQGSTSTRTTDIRSPLQRVMKEPNFEARQAVYNESMTPVRNWAAEIAEGAFQFDKSPSKLVQLPMASEVAASTIPPVTVEDEEEEYSEDDDVSADDEIDRSESFFQEFSPSMPKSIPQVNRLRESPIVITSSPPEELPQIHYQWKTVADPPPSEPDVSVLESEEEMSDSLSEPEISMSQCRLSSRQSSPARSILTDLGDDIIDISSLSPFAAKRAANILLQSSYYSKITFDDTEGQKIWRHAQDAAGEYELSQLPYDDNESEEEEEEMEDVEESPEPVAPPRISQGEWTKIDWKRLEKCLDFVDGEMNDAIDLFLERYFGREREEVETRCRAVLLTRRRRVLEGRKVGFILSTDE